MGLSAGVVVFLGARSPRTSDKDVMGSFAFRLFSLMAHINRDYEARVFQKTGKRILLRRAADVTCFLMQVGLGDINQEISGLRAHRARGRYAK
jgi:hypothetical protein